MAMKPGARAWTQQVDSVYPVRHNAVMTALPPPSFEALSGMLEDFARSHSEIQALFVFGSLATAKAHEASDADIAVLLHDAIDDRRATELSLAYCIELEDRLNVPVDVIVLNAANPLLRFQVFKKGKMVYSADPARTRRFIGDTLVEFYDAIVMIERVQQSAIGRLIGR